jgi:hypothetical protein
MSGRMTEAYLDQQEMWAAAGRVDPDPLFAEIRACWAEIAALKADKARLDFLLDLEGMSYDQHMRLLAHETEDTGRAYIDRCIAQNKQERQKCKSTRKK